MTLPRTVTVLIDEREKAPTLFPDTIKYWPDRGTDSTLIRIKTERRTLPYGDFMLAKWPKACVIERKSGLQELHNNLFTEDWPRFEAACSRMRAACSHPVLLLDGSVADLYTSFKEVSPGRVQDALFRMTRAGLWSHVLLTGALRSPASRRQLGETLVRLMLSYAI